jgi:hypothetical protein
MAGNEREHVRGLIKEAFTSVAFPFHNAPPDWQPHVWALQRAYGEPLYPYVVGSTPAARQAEGDIGVWHGELLGLAPEAFQYVVPRLMVWVLDHLDWAADELVSFFAVPTGDLYGRVKGTLAKAKRENFAPFTREQIRAVIAWLEIAQGWKDEQLLGEQYEWDLEEALAYWNRVLTDGAHPVI